LNLTDSNIRQLAQMAFSALQAGDAKQAVSGFEKIVSTGEADTMHWMGLAVARSRLGDNANAMSALDKSLELEPRNLRAVLLKADLLAMQNQSRAAFQHYRYALQLAGNAPDLPADIRQGLARAQSVCSEQEKAYREFMLERLQAEGFALGDAPPRFRQSLDLLFGDKEIYYQQPRRFYYPGLPQIQFYEREQFDWIPAIEAETERIRAELIPVLQEPSLFSPYVKSGDAKLGQDNQGLADNDDWGALFLWDYGRLLPENAALFPNTVRALEAAPMPVIARQAPMALFSKLAPGTRIPPHNGLLNTRLICHLPLVVPPDCGALRVGNEERPWVEGEMLIFDDSIQHEAWNNSDQQRVILLFEIWRPEISTEERTLLAGMLTAVKEFANQEKG
jgi:aspartyl/asparaginyl beta-hydroxylase (cupin superfamily)